MSRSSTKKFLVGQFCDNVPESQLPTGRDVLKFLYHKKYEESSKSKQIPLDRKTHTSKNDENKSCTERKVLSRSLGCMKAGFPTIQYRFIKDKVLGLDKEWMKPNKHANK